MKALSVAGVGAVVGAVAQLLIALGVEVPEGTAEAVNVAVGAVTTAVAALVAAYRVNMTQEK